jgi:hypothetical protein
MEGKKKVRVKEKKIQRGDDGADEKVFYTKEIAFEG